MFLVIKLIKQTLILPLIINIFVQNAKILFMHYLMKIITLMEGKHIFLIMVILHQTIIIEYFQFMNVLTKILLKIHYIYQMKA